MKKVILFFALVMGFAFGLNAQNVLVGDTISHFDSVTLYSPANDTIDAAEFYVFETDSMVSDLTVNNTYVTFNLSGIDSVRGLIMYVEGIPEDDTNIYVTEYTYYWDGWSSSYLFDTIWNDSIVRIDTSYGGHPGLYIYDTIYAYDSIIIMIDSVPILHSFFQNGYNELKIEDYSVIFDIVLVPVWMDTTTPEEFSLTLTDINLITNADYLAIEDVQTKNIKVYPNPTNGKVNIEGEYKRLTITDVRGSKHITIDTPVNTVNMSNLKNGTYIFQFDTITSVKVIKY